MYAGLNKGIEQRRTSSDSNNLPVVRSKTQGSVGVAPGLSVATVETSVQEGLQAPVPTLPHHFPSPRPTRTFGQGPAPAPQLHPRSLRRLLHPCALWQVKVWLILNTLLLLRNHFPILSKCKTWTVAAVVLLLMVTYSPKVAARGGLSCQPRVDLEQVRATVLVVGARRPTSPSSSSYIYHHGGSAISDTHLEPGGVASACRTHYFLLTTLPESETLIGEHFPVWRRSAFYNLK